jgi:hypothetical protein
MFAASSFFDIGHEEAAPTTGNQPAPKPQR